MPPTDVASEAAIILDRQHVQIPYMPGELPGSEPSRDMDNMFAGGVAKPPVDPKILRRAVMTNGSLMAVVSAVAEGCAGVRYEIENRFNSSMSEDEEFKVDEPKTWSPEIKEQRNKLQVLIQAGFLGRGATGLRAGFREQELDRVILGWSGVGVMREATLPNEKNEMPPKPRAFTRFEACNGRWSRASRTTTMVPIPIALEDGTVWWIEEPRHFRRLRVQLANGRYRWFKEYGDWRAMDAMTGKYSTGNRYTPSTQPGKPGTYKAGALPKKAVPAGEIMTWRTPFPGLYPYGWSGWHSELKSSAAANEHIDLILAYLKSGLHSVILAASNRPFEDASAHAAVEKIDELGRGRKGLAALITLALVPGDSSGTAAQMPNFGNDASADRGRLVLHELTTKLPTELLQENGLQTSLATRFSESERIPALLLGRSDSYNFATASAAWSVVNRLRFGPHHEEREAFLDRILIEMGITFWRIKIVSPEWDEKEPISGVTSVTGQLGGVSINQAMQLFSDTVGADFDPREEWWGNVPMPFVSSILTSIDPGITANLLGVELPEEAVNEAVIPGIMDAVNALTEQIDRLTSVSGGDGDDGDGSGEENEDEPNADEEEPNVKRPRGRPAGS